MVKRWIVIMLMCCGCVSMNVDEDSGTGLNYRQSELTKIKQINIGMDTTKVASLMGDSLVIGYEKNPDLAGSFIPVRISQPYKSEMVTLPGGVYEIQYYVTRVYKSDGIISEEELTPLIFENGFLVGKGRPDMDKILQGNP